MTDNIEISQNRWHEVTTGRDRATFFVQSCGAITPELREKVEKAVLAAGLSTSNIYTSDDARSHDSLPDNRIVITLPEQTQQQTSATIKALKGTLGSINPNISDISVRDPIPAPACGIPMSSRDGIDISNFS